MSEILGYDCNGKALRLGDEVEIVRAAPYFRHFVGMKTKVIGPSYDFPGSLAIDILINGASEVSALGEELRRIDDQERGDWSEIEKATGWNPAREPAPALPFVGKVGLIVRSG